MPLVFIITKSQTIHIEDLENVDIFYVMFDVIYPIHICTICIIQLYSKICITVITLSFRRGICEMWVHDGPLLDARTSHVPIGMLKLVAQAALRFANVNSSCSKGTNSLGCIGLKVYLLSGSDECF